MHTINMIYELINNDPAGIHAYYNKRDRRFEYHYESDLDSDYLIKTPCSYEMKHEIKMEFYSLLSKKQYVIATSYPFRKGYFSYLREIGLYELYMQAEDTVKEITLLIWIIKNHISFDEKCFDIDCSYL